MEWIVQQWIPGMFGAGHWYECRRVTAATKAEAIRAAGWIEVPYGYRLVLV